MSYVRFGADGSDVYVFHCASADVIECCGCAITPSPAPNPAYARRSEVINHLLEHQHAGHVVPRWVLEGLWEEIKTIGDAVTNTSGPYAIS